MKAPGSALRAEEAPVKGGKQKELPLERGSFVTTEAEPEGQIGGRREAPPPDLPSLSIDNNCIAENEADDFDPNFNLLPGPRKKQAQALSDNIQDLCKMFGVDAVGFQTLTVGDKDASGRFQHIRIRRESERRFHSLLTNEISKRYRCGVVVTERHRDGGIHFHLVVALAGPASEEAKPVDIRTGFDWVKFDALKEAVKRGERRGWRASEVNATPALKAEWKFWRKTAKQYGFGRCELTPVRSNPVALARYVGEYLSKDWLRRRPDDKGARCVRYFGHWHTKAKGKRPAKPRFNHHFGYVTPRARALREMWKQAVTVVNSKGAGLNEDNAAEKLGPRRMWYFRKLIRVVCFVDGEWLDPATAAAIREHNEQVAAHLAQNGEKVPYRWHVTQLTLDHLRPSPEDAKQAEELQLVKDVESAIRKGLRKQKRAEEKHQAMLRLLDEAAAEFDFAPQPLEISRRT